MEQPVPGSVRINFWFIILALILTGFGARLFDLQVLRRDYYRKLALSSQLKEYEIPASRGVIEAYDGDRIVPFVLNEKKYTLFADPVYISNPVDTARQISATIGGNASEYEGKMHSTTRYSVLAKKLSGEQKSQIEALNIKGIGLREQQYRTYPQGEMAARLLGFVNDDGEGKYGVEEFFNDSLGGTPGELKAITDASGTPLFANKENVIKEPQPGSKILLTLDISMQKQVEDILRQGLERAKSTSGSVIVMDPGNGEIKALASLPGYNPADFASVEDPARFINDVAGVPLEVGSVMKALTAAASLNEGVVSPEYTYYDPGTTIVDTHTISNVQESSGAGTRTVTDILRLSLNTGAVHLLRQLGGGELNEQGRVRWHDYLVNKYGFGKLTGIEQGYEAAGSVPDPKEGFGLDIQYANMSFGQGLNITPVQFAAAFASAVNGGNYYKPCLVRATADETGEYKLRQPELLRQGIVRPEVSNQLRSMLVNVLNQTVATAKRDGYAIGGKTGSAEITKPEGGYYDDRYNGTYVGFVGGDQPEYVIFVRVNEPKISGHSGARAARPIFLDAVNMLINNFNVAQTSQ